MLKVALTHDIDRVEKTAQYLTHSFRRLMQGDYKGAFQNAMNIKNRKNEYWNFERIMEIEDKYSVRSTVFFLNEPVSYNFIDYRNFIHSFGRYNIKDERITGIIKTLDKGGWEIGVHGSFNSFKSSAALKNEKNTLEEILGKEIYGIRQHYLNLIPGKTWEYQSGAGFLYDSSWGYSNQTGIKDGKVRPFAPLNNHFIVFPLFIMDYCFMQEENRWNKFELLCSEIEKHNGVLVINWHNNEFSRNDYPGSEEAYIECIERCSDKGAVFKCLIDFYREYIADGTE